MATDLSDSIQESAAAPQRIVVDGVVSEEHPLRDQIAADRYLAGLAATRSAKKGFSIAKLSPPGTT